jgi:hypothetical protein
MAKDLHLKSRIGEVLRAWRGGRVLAGAGAAAGLAATLMSASPASANEPIFADAGVHVGWLWGEGGGFTWGFEGRVGSTLDEPDSCGAEVTPAAAATVRVDFVDSVRLRLSGGGQIGVFWGPTSLLADLGVAYRWGEGGGVSFPLGLDLQVWAINAFVSADAGLNGGYVGGGFRLPPPDRQIGCVAIGRPLHDENGRTDLPPLQALGPQSFAGELDRAMVEELGERARGEWASVPAFLQLAEQLHHAHAPRVLVERALIAAEDEVRHAMLTAQAAVRVGGAPLRIARVTPRTRVPAQGMDALRRLAVESWVDGCLGEGKAAAAAALESQRAELDAMQRLQGVIAREETSHAELAWDVLAWTVARGGDDVRHAVAAVREATPEGESGTREGIDLTPLGLMSARDHGRIGERTREAALGRLDALLS